MRDKIEALHNLYRRVSKMDVGLRFDRESSWHEFVRSGFTEQDLEMVMKRIMDLIKIGDRRVEALRFSNLIQQLDRFEEELALAKAGAEGLKSTDRQLTIGEMKSVLKAKEESADDLSDKYACPNAFGLTWSDPNRREDYKSLRKEIARIRSRIAGAIV